MAESEIEPSVFVHENGDLKIHLNTASEAEGNGINLAPSGSLPGNPALALTYSALERLCQASARQRQGG